MDMYTHAVISIQMPHLQEIKIEASPDQYKRAAKKERRGGGRYHTLPISFQEIKVLIVVLIISTMIVVVVVVVVKRRGEVSHPTNLLPGDKGSDHGFDY